LSDYEYKEEKKRNPNRCQEGQNSDRMHHVLLADKSDFERTWSDMCGKGCVSLGREAEGKVGNDVEKVVVLSNRIGIFRKNTPISK